MQKDYLKIGKYKLRSRLIVGTGKYKNFKETAKAIKASGADMVTVAVRRINILDKKKPILTDYLDPKKIIYFRFFIDLTEIFTRFKKFLSTLNFVFSITNSCSLICDRKKFLISCFIFLIW